MLPPTQVNASLAYSSSNESAAFMSNPGFTIISPGDYNSTTLTKQFKICSNSSVSTSLSYTFKAVVNGTDSAYYVAQNPELTVTVFSTLGNITAPTNATVPKGGCSTLLSITTTKLPESDVDITISNLAANKLYTNLTSNSATFSNSSASSRQSFLICSNELAVVNSTGTLPFILSGNSSNDYLLANGDNITFTITAAPSPTIVALPPKSYTAGQGDFGFSSNIEGKYYCSVREGVFANDTNSLSYYKGLVDSNSTTIQSSADFLTRLYPQPRDWSVVSTNLLPAATSNVTLLNKRPETNYSFCCYYQNTAGTTTTGPSCNTYLTPPDDTWKRHSVIFTFTTALSATQRNKLLGFMATTIGGLTSQIVNRRGESYSNATTTPKKEWYVYSGGTDSKNSDTVFLTVKDSSSALTYVQNLDALFETNGSLTLTASSYINNSIDGLLLTGRYNLSQGYASTLVGSRIANIPALLLNQTGSYISVSNVQLDYPGSVMFGVGLVNSTLPSQEQLMNCQDGLNTSFVSCARFIVNDGNTNNTFVLQNVTGSNRYKVYYLPTNDFVERPVAAGDVLAISVSNLTYSITLPQSTISLSK